MYIILETKGYFLFPLLNSQKGYYMTSSSKEKTSSRVGSRRSATKLPHRMDRGRLGTVRDFTPQPKGIELKPQNRPGIGKSLIYNF